MATSTIFGWDLLYSSVEKEVKNNQDILVCLAHLILVSNGFKCIGLGKSYIMDESGHREVLPKGWTQNYDLKYVYQGRLYNFKATSLDGGLMLNFGRSDDPNVSLVQFKTRSVVNKTGSLEDMIPDYRNIVDTINKQLLEKVEGFKRYRESASQTLDPKRDILSFDLLKGPLFDPLADVKVLYTEGTDLKI